MATLKTKKRAVKRALQDWTEDKYCKYFIGARYNGQGVDPRDEEAVMWCASGRLAKVAAMKTVEEIEYDFRLKYNYWHVWQVNDYKGYEAVVTKLKGLYE